MTDIRISPMPSLQGFIVQARSMTGMAWLRLQSCPVVSFMRVPDVAALKRSAVASRITVEQLHHPVEKFDAETEPLTSAEQFEPDGAAPEA